MQYTYTRGTAVQLSVHTVYRYGGYRCVRQGENRAICYILKFHRAFFQFTE